MAQMVGVFRIGNEPVLRYTPGGDAVLGLSLACNYGQKGDDGNRPTQWYDAALWGKRAEALEPYLHKGDKVYVILSDVHLDTFKRTSDNTVGTKIAARVSEIELLGGNGVQQQQQGQQQQRQQGNGQDYARASGRDQPPSAPRRREPEPAPRHDDMDDDIPF